MDSAPDANSNHAWRWLWVVLVLLTVFTASGNTVEAPFMPRVYAPDKIAHVAVFGLIATLVYRSLPAAMNANLKCLIAAFGVSAFGLSDEIHQSFTPTRTFDWYDFLADVLGAVVATAAYRWLHIYRRLLEWRLPLPRRKKANKAPTL